MTAMHCRPLDPGDRYHARLANIVEEMRLATGAPRIECVTVRTVGPQRVRLQRPPRGRSDRRHRGRARQALAAAAGGGGRARVRAHPVGQLRHRHGVVPAVRHLLVAGGESGRRGRRLVGHGRGVGGRADDPAARLAVGDAAGVVGGERRDQPPARVAGRPGGGALHARPAGAGRGPARRQPASRRRGVHPRGPRAALHPRDGQPGVARRRAGATRTRRSRRASAPCSASPTSRRTSSSGRRRRRPRTSSRREHWSPAPGAAPAPALAGPARVLRRGGAVAGLRRARERRSRRRRAQPPSSAPA